MLLSPVPVLSLTPALSLSPDFVIVPLLCHRLPTLSLSPCSVIVPLLCHCSPALSSSPVSVMVVLLCHGPAALSSSPCPVIVPCFNHGSYQKRQSPSAPRKSLPIFRLRFPFPIIPTGNQKLSSDLDSVIANTANQMTLLICRYVSMKTRFLFSPASFLFFLKQNRSAELISVLHVTRVNKVD